MHLHVLCVCVCVCACVHVTRHFGGVASRGVTVGGAASGGVTGGRWRGGQWGRDGWWGGAVRACQMVAQMSKAEGRRIKPLSHLIS